jgi:hypothetical protein
MTGKLERRKFLKICGSAAAGGVLLNPYDLMAGDINRKKTRFKLSRPRWIIYENGSYDLISKEIILKNCRPAIDGQTVMPRNVFLGDSPKGIRIVYELSGGFMMLDLQTNEDSLSIGAEFSGFSQSPRWFFPISQAKVFGVDQFYRQGFGTGGPSGVHPIIRPNTIDTGKIGPWENWSYDSYLMFAFLGNEETIAIGNTDHRDFLQRSTIYSYRHRQRLKDIEEGDGGIFFEAAMLLNQTKIKNEYIKLPNLYFYTGNKAYETLQELAWRTSEKTEARQGSVTSYHWISKSEDNEQFSFDKLKKQIDYLTTMSNPPHLHTLSINKGYCIAGDWLEPNDNWPGGLERAAREIFKHGYRAGIWLAPFMVSEKSNLFQKHSDWLIKNFQNELIIEKTEGDENFYALDPSHPGALKYLGKVFQTLRKIGFIFYELDYLEWGLKDSHLVKRAAPAKSSVQTFREAMDMIREEIGYGSLIMADKTSFGPVIGYADILKMAEPIGNRWDDCVTDMIRESYFTQYFNNVLWQNNSGEIRLTDDNSFTEDEKFSLALWISFLGGAVSTLDNFTEWENEQVTLFRFLEPGKLYQNAYFPFWPSTEEIKIAVRFYKRFRSWGVLFFNDKEDHIIKTYPVFDFTDEDSTYIFNWKPGFIIAFGEMEEITINLQPHQSRLFWFSKNNEPPPDDLTLGGEIPDSLAQ